MSSRIHISWQLSKIAFNELKHHKILLIPATLSILLNIYLVITVIDPLRHAELLSWQVGQALPSGHFLWLVLEIAAMVICLEVIMTLNAAIIITLYSSTLKRSQRLLVALPKLLAWAFFNAMAGTIYRLLEVFRFNYSKKIIAWLSGVSWGIATFFAIPIIMHRKTSPLVTLAQSKELLSEHWGNELLSNASLAVLLFFAYGVALLPTLLGFFIGGAAAHGFYAASAVWAIIATIARSTLHHILQVKLYHYAIQASDDNAATSIWLQKAFQPRQLIRKRL